MGRKNTIGHKIKVFRKGLHWSQADLSRASGVSQSRISVIENAEDDSRLLVDTLTRIADAMGAPISFFFEDYYDDELTKENYNTPDSPDHSDATAASLINQNILATFYPVSLSSKNPAYDNPISNLLEFLVYLPLIDQYQLWENLHSFNGDYIGNEEFVASVLGSLINAIPESPAKHYANCISTEIDLITSIGGRQEAIERLQKSNYYKDGSFEDYQTAICVNMNTTRIFHNLKHLFGAFDLLDSGDDGEKEISDQLRVKIASRLQDMDSTIPI